MDTRMVMEFDLQRFAEESGEAPLDQPNSESNKPETPNSTSQEPLSSIEQQLSGLSAEQLLKFAPIRTLVESARSQEKNKVYSTVQAKDAEIKRLQDEVKQLKDQLQAREMQSLNEQEILQRELAAMKARMDELERQASEARLKAYREARLREVGEEIIPELVQGNSEEEIDQAIELAKAKYQELKERFFQQIKAQGKNPPPATPPVTNPPTNPSQPFSFEQIRQMSHEEWAKNRKRIFEAAKQGQLR